MRRKFDVVGLGYTALDYLGIVPHLPAENRKLELLDFHVQGGGPAATALVTARRLGLSASLIGKVGDDDFGRRMLSELKLEKVETGSAIIETGASSQFAFIMVDESTAARTILWTRGSVSRIKPDEIDRGLIGSARVLLVDDLEPTAALAAAHEANELGIPVVIDAGSLRPGVEEILPCCDYIIASEVFAEQLTSGNDHVRALEELLAFGPAAAAVTLGERGCVALSADGFVEAEGFEVDAVDTTGAGDVFHGAFLFALLQEWDLYHSCVFSNAVAALSCRALGGRESIPDLDGALSFLGRRRPDIDFSL